MKPNSCACYGSNDIHECYCNKQNNMKQVTAVEWLIEQLSFSISLQQKYIDELLEQAKAMEKEQIIKFTNDYLDDDRYLTAEHYYNEIYKTI